MNENVVYLYISSESRETIVPLSCDNSLSLMPFKYSPTNLSQYCASDVRMKMWMVNLFVIVSLIKLNSLPSSIVSNSAHRKSNYIKPLYIYKYINIHSDPSYIQTNQLVAVSVWRRQQQRLRLRRTTNHGSV